MSGGSWDYLNHRIDDAAERLAISPVPIRRVFGAHLRKVSAAIQALDMADSGDWGQDEVEPKIREALGREWPAAEVQLLRDEAEKLLGRLLTIGGVAGI